jgi:hypothetical protein
MNDPGQKMPQEQAIRTYDREGFTGIQTHQSKANQNFPARTFTMVRGFFAILPGKRCALMDASDTQYARKVGRVAVAILILSIQQVTFPP